MRTYKFGKLLNKIRLPIIYPIKRLFSFSMIIILLRKIMYFRNKKEFKIMIKKISYCELTKYK